VITGAARDVGRAIGQHFRAAGATVYLVDHDSDEVEVAANEVDAVGWPPTSPGPPTSPR
jgi:3-oxoacyl-[acyl-carrier protein] reductase